jgi:hypothetical protein
MSRRQWSVAVAGRMPFIKVAAFSADSRVGAPPGNTTGQQVAKDRVETVDDTGPLAGQVVVPLGQQPQDRGLVLRGDLAQISAEERDLGHVESICGVGLPVPAGGQETCPGRQGGRHVNDILARGGRLLGKRPAETAGAFDREPAPRPLRAPVQKPTEGPGVDDEPPLTNFVACCTTATAVCEDLWGSIPMVIIRILT